MIYKPVYTTRFVIVRLFNSKLTCTHASTHSLVHVRTHTHVQTHLGVKPIDAQTRQTQCKTVARGYFCIVTVCINLCISEKKIEQAGNTR